MTINEFLGTLEVATTVKVKSEDDKVLFEAAHTSDIFRIIGSYKVVSWKVTDANRVIMKINISEN